MNSITTLDRKEIEKRFCKSTMRRVMVSKKNCRIFEMLKLWFPPKVSNLQPSDSVIIIALRRQYRRNKVNLALGNAENNSKLTYDVHQLTAMKRFKKFRKN